MNKILSLGVWYDLCCACRGILIISSYISIKWINKEITMGISLLFKNKFFSLVGAALLSMPMLANAGLMGSTVNLDFYYPNQASLYCTSGNAVVGGGVEYASGCSGFGPVSLDIANNLLTVNTGGIGWSGGAFNGILLSILSGPSILSASYGGGSMATTGLSVVNGDLWVNFAGQSGGVAYINVSTVSEPAALSLLALGLAGLGYIRKRKTT